ncbi:hypothetical protein AtNW77_Chr2g0249721 [Arabidopsis thaliana]
MLFFFFVSLSFKKSFINNHEEEKKNFLFCFTFIFHILYSPPQRSPFVFPL